jgi:hypothetical protein
VYTSCCLLFPEAYAGCVRAAFSFNQPFPCNMSSTPTQPTPRDYLGFRSTDEDYPGAHGQVEKLPNGSARLVRGQAACLGAT